MNLCTPKIQKQGGMASGLLKECLKNTHTNKVRKDNVIYHKIFVLEFCRKCLILYP